MGIYFKNRVLVGMTIVILLIISLSVWKFTSGKKSSPTYQTQSAEKGTLVTSVSASGTITAGNNVSITTTASGIAQTVYVKQGDTVVQGQKLAEITLDQDSQQLLAAAWSSYLSAKNQLTSAQNTMYSLQSSMFSKWKSFTELSENSTYTNPDGSPNAENRTLPEYIIAQNDWLLTEAQYKNQQNVIAQAQSAVNNAWLSYQQISPTILAPSSGIITNLIMAPGIPIQSLSSSTSTSSRTSQTVGTIQLPNGNTQAVINIAEIDSPKVQPGQKVTITLDSQADKTYTGKVLFINTSGSVSSGVTTYPAAITFDSSVSTIYPNMAISVNIITDVKDNVILVPNAAVSTSNGQSTVNVLKNGSPTSVQVTIGKSNDTQTEIVSGINVGDIVVTGSTQSTTSTSSTTSSPFSAFGNRSGFGGGANVRIIR